MKRVLLLTVLTLAFGKVSAQKFILSEGFVQFYSEAALEDIKAINKKTSGLFNVETGEVAFIIPVNQFQFEKKLMQEHFNEKYMESDKFPKASFAGTIREFDIDKSGEQMVVAKGQLTIHGVTQPVEVKGVAEKQGDIITLRAVFMVRLEDYKVKIPQLMWQNIAEQVEVTIDVRFKPQ
jgi:polyisoprenoid-binding protein YceI